MRVSSSYGINRRSKCRPSDQLVRPYGQGRRTGFDKLFKGTVRNEHFRHPGNIRTDFVLIEQKSNAALGKHKIIVKRKFAFFEIPDILRTIVFKENSFGNW